MINYCMNAESICFYQLKNRGQFDAKRWGQFNAKKWGQFAAEKGGLYERNFQYSGKVIIANDF